MDYLLHHGLVSSASSTPDHTAVVDRDRSLTYAELDRRSNQLANLLAESGASAGDRIGLYLDKSLESIVAIYGVLKAGATYVPLDPHAPVARLAYIAKNCGIRVLLSGREKAAQWSKMADEGSPVTTYVTLNSRSNETGEPPRGATLLGVEELDASADSAPACQATSVDLAYILYTSGSTGDPKGVMLSHRNAITFVDWSVEEFGVGSGDRLSSHAPLHFDLSVFDIFVSARAGATLVLVPARIAIIPVEVTRFIERNGITIWYSVPSILSMMAQRGNLPGADLSRLRTLIFAGEVFPTKYLRLLMDQVPHVRFCNLYGPTETNVCTYFDVPALPPDQVEPISIGRAIADVEVFAVTDAGGRAKPGEVGELYVRGSTVMQGYWGDPDRTARSLVSHPLKPELGGGVYRTGDLVQEREDGNFLFLGRRDSQIKSRGYRIELGDIESALYANPAVIECAVVATPDEVVSNRISAYVVAPGVSEADLTRFCAERIPRYMIPEKFNLRDGLPKTSTGKTDRQALAKEAAAEGRNAEAGERHAEEQAETKGLK